MAESDSYTGMRAYWSDKKGATQKDVLVGTRENARRLPATYRSGAEAKEQAGAAHKRNQRGVAAPSYTLALGRPDVYPEQRLHIRGIKPQIDDTE